MGNAKYHVLLVGIDDYPVSPLRGCVNDIDAVQAVLVGPGMKLPADCITRLAAPRPVEGVAPPAAGTLPTLANLRAQLARLGSAQVKFGDRVFIYYSGHGGRIERRDASGHPFHRESIIPMDVIGPDGVINVLFDHEINGLLRAIAARTPRITMILDSCHAAGATREGGDAGAWSARYLDLDELIRRGAARDLPAGAEPADAAPSPTASRGAPSRARLARGIDDVLVVGACLDHQRAMERPNAAGVRQGVLTQALLHALAGAGGLDLETLSWAAIWQAMRAEIEQRNPAQNPWMSGNAARLVFAGPPVDGDPGFPVTGVAGGYRIAAGSLAGITRGAELAIYGDYPRSFPALDSEAHRKHCVGVLRVTDATRASATAVLHPTHGKSFELPPGARGRLIQPGETAQITYATEPATPALEARIGSPLLARAAGDAKPTVWLERSGDRWFVTDDVHGTGEDGPVLCAMTADELGHARDVLEHYYAYSRPLRMANAEGNLAGALALRVLACPADRALTAAEAQEVQLDEAASTGTAAYALRSGARVCFAVHNSSPHRLEVTLVNVAASGKVQLLGNHSIDAGARFRFWAGNVLGQPFQMVPPPGSPWCADRLIAIGRTVVGHDLGYLRVARTFAHWLERRRGDEPATRDIDDGSDSLARTATLDHWAAVQVVIETRA